MGTKARSIGWLSISLVVACDHSTSPEPPRPASVLVTPDMLHLILLDTARLRALVRDQSGAVLPSVAVTWSSSDTSIVSVNDSGSVHAVRRGGATITATADSSKGTASVSVVAPITAIRLLPSSARISDTDTLQLHARMQSVDGGPPTDSALQWTSSDTIVAAVGVSGRVIAHEVGSVVITVMTQQNLQATASIAVTPSSTFVDVSTGFFHTCALLGNRMAYCWGRNVNYQIGTGEVTSRDSIPTVVVGGLKYANLAGGQAHTCGVSNDGSAFCWGNNSDGQLGSDLSDPPLAPIPVSTSERFSAISAAAFHTCALTQEGAPYCWGRGLGFGRDGTMVPPTPVPGGFTFTMISAGDYQVCGLVASGAAYCWGNNQFGSLGNDTTTGPTATPVAVMGNLTFQSIGAGNVYTCGLTTDGFVYCWGWNNTGQLGDSSTTDRSVPARVYGGQSFKRLAVGSAHACAITQSDKLFCWGNDLGGQLGTAAPLGTCDGFGACSLIPVAVVGNHSLRSVSGGQYHTCGIDLSYRLLCWGMNRDGQIGIGTVTDIVPEPVEVTPPSH